MSGEEDDRLDDLEPLSPEEEQAVSALLASLPAEPMPAEVFSRIEAALAAEPAPLPLAPVVSLNAPSRRKASRGPLIFKVAASVVGLVGAVALGLAVVQGGGAASNGGAAETAGGAAKSAAAGASAPALAASGSGVPAASSAVSTIPSAARPPRVSQSRFDYDQANLTAAATALVTGRALAAATTSPNSAAASSTGTDAAGSASSYSTASLVTTASLLDSCVKEITDGSTRTPIAVDAGQWKHQPAVVIVLPALDDPTNLEVFVVKASCGRVKDSSDLLQFTNIPRP